MGNATMVKNMRAFIDLCRSRKGRIALNVSSAVLGIGVYVLVVGVESWILRHERRVDAMGA